MRTAKRNADNTAKAIEGLLRNPHSMTAKVRVRDAVRADHRVDPEIKKAVEEATDQPLVGNRHARDAREVAEYFDNTPAPRSI